MWLCKLPTLYVVIFSTVYTCMFPYQTPGCSKSGLFKAFSEYVMGRLGIIQEKKLQVLSRTFFVQWISGDSPLQKIPGFK